MKCGGREGADLLLDRVHMLHRPEGNNHQWIFLFEAEIVHVTIMGANPFAHLRRLTVDLLTKNAEHGQRTVETVNGDARTGDW